MNLASERAVVTIADGVVTPQELLTATSAAGYPAELAETSEGHSAVARK